MNQPLSSPAQIMVIDQNRLFREKMSFLLSQSLHHYEIVTDFEDIDAGIQCLQQNHMDLLLIEAALLINSREQILLKNILLSQPQLRVILLTSYQQPYVETLTNYLGISHTLMKMIEPNELLGVITKILASPLNEIQALNYLESLTPRELEILEWLVKGDSNKEIARGLDISESTVKVHVQNILKKFNVSSRVEAAVYAVRNELSI